MPEFDMLVRYRAPSCDILPGEGRREQGHIMGNVRLCAAVENTARAWVDRAAFKRVGDVYRKAWDSPPTVTREVMNVTAVEQRGEGGWVV